MEFAESIKCLSFSKSSNILALGMDGSLFLFSVPNRSMIVSKTYGSSIRSLSFSNHDERLAVALSDGTLSLLCPDDDWRSAGEIDYSDSPIICQDWCTNTFAIGREDGSVAIFDLEKGLGEFFVPIAEFSANSPVRSMAFGPGGRYLGKFLCCLKQIFPVLLFLTSKLDSFWR